MRLLKDHVLHVWQRLKSEASCRTADVERRLKAIQQKLDRLDNAFLESVQSNRRNRSSLQVLGSGRGR